MVNIAGVGLRDSPGHDIEQLGEGWKGQVLMIFRVSMSAFSRLGEVYKLQKCGIL